MTIKVEGVRLFVDEALEAASKIVRNPEIKKFIESGELFISIIDILDKCFGFNGEGSKYWEAFADSNAMKDVIDKNIEYWHIDNAGRMLSQMKHEKVKGFKEVALFIVMTSGCENIGKILYNPYALYEGMTLRSFIKGQVKLFMDGGFPRQEAEDLAKSSVSRLCLLTDLCDKGVDKQEGVQFCQQVADKVVAAQKTKKFFDLCRKKIKDIDSPEECMKICKSEFDSI